MPGRMISAFYKPTATSCRPVASVGAIVISDSEEEEDAALKELRITIPPRQTKRSAPSTVSPSERKARQPTSSNSPGAITNVISLLTPSTGSSSSKLSTAPTSASSTASSTASSRLQSLPALERVKKEKIDDDEEEEIYISSDGNSNLSFIVDDGEGETPQDSDASISDTPRPVKLEKDESISQPTSAEARARKDRWSKSKKRVEKVEPINVEEQLKVLSVKPSDKELNDLLDYMTYREAMELVLTDRFPRLKHLFFARIYNAIKYKLNIAARAKLQTEDIETILMLSNPIEVICSKSILDKLPFRANAMQVNAFCVYLTHVAYALHNQDKPWASLMPYDIVDETAITVEEEDDEVSVRTTRRSNYVVQPPSKLFALLAERFLSASKGIRQFFKMLPTSLRDQYNRKAVEDLNKACTDAANNVPNGYVGVLTNEVLYDGQDPSYHHLLDTKELLKVVFRIDAHQSNLAEEVDELRTNRHHESPSRINAFRVKLFASSKKNRIHLSDSTQWEWFFRYWLSPAGRKLLTPAQTLLFLLFLRDLAQYIPKDKYRRYMWQYLVWDIVAEHWKMVFSNLNSNVIESMRIIYEKWLPEKEIQYVLEKYPKGRFAVWHKNFIVDKQVNFTYDKATLKAKGNNLRAKIFMRRDLHETISSDDNFVKGDDDGNSSDDDVDGPRGMPMHAHIDRTSTRSPVVIQSTMTDKERNLKEAIAAVSRRKVVYI